MTKQHFVKSARTDIFQGGKPTIKIHQRGKSKGKEYVTFDITQPAPDNYNLLVKKGESYYWCKFKNQQKRIRLTPFSNDELRYGRFGKPEWEEKYEDFSFRVEDTCGSDESEREELKVEIEEYRDELQDRLSNMPDSLQEGSVLNERIEMLDELIEQIEE